jgi:hypothetical protein
MLYRRILRKLHGGVVTPYPVGKKRALLSYTTFPFICTESELTGHSNRWEARCIARLLNEQGFAVDVVDFEDNSFIPRHNYSLCIDNGHQLERLSKYLPSDCTTVFHATTSHWLFQNQAEYTRLLALARRKGFILAPRRTLPFSKNAELAEHITLTGNETTAETYAHVKKKITRIPVSTTHEFDVFERDYLAARKNFVWIGGSGSVHKGLDLVIEAFTGRDGSHLDIFGKIDPDFFEAYRDILTSQKTITYHGFVDPGSEEFKTAVSNSASIIFPSCSESTSTAVVTAMHAGLIPLVSREAGIEVSDFGIELANATVEIIKQAVETIEQTPPEKLKSKSLRARDYVRNHHSRENFEKAYRDFLLSIL